MGNRWQRLLSTIERALVWLGRYPPYAIDADYWVLLPDIESTHVPERGFAPPRKDAA